MNVSSVASAPSSVQNLFAKPKQDLQSLQNALNSGDLAGAQKDFADFKKDMTGLLGALPTSPAATPQASLDFKTLQQDLNAGDLGSSQKDFASILQDLAAAGGPHKHHHRHPADKTSDASASTATTSDYRAVMAAYAAFSKSGSSLNTTA